MSVAFLPEADDVFARFFARWYRHEDVAARRYAATRPDVESWAEPRAPATIASPLTVEGQRRIIEQIGDMLQAVQADWPGYLPVTGALSLDWIEAFDEHWTRERVRELLDRSDPADHANDLLVIACEFGAALGHVMQQRAPHLEWLAECPYWDSALLDVRSGYRINTFHWAIKRFSEYGLEDGYAAKLTRCLELVDEGWPR